MPGSVEAISGALIGRCLAQDVLPPFAFLHHPETSEGEVDALHYVMHNLVSG